MKIPVYLTGSERWERPCHLFASPTDACVLCLHSCHHAWCHLAVLKGNELQTVQSDVKAKRINVGGSHCAGTNVFFGGFFQPGSA